MELAMNETEWVWRLTRVFGPQWQAALDHAQVMSRRRARELGAGDEPTPTFVALLEFLETCPRRLWPERWRQIAHRFPGKVSDTCPTIDRFRDRLRADGRIDPVDAVFVWDLKKDGDQFHHANVAIGLLPTLLHDLPWDDPLREQWRHWNGQWDSAHGGAIVGDWLERDEATPEGVIAGWIVRGRLRTSDAPAVLQEAERMIYGFSKAKVDQFARRSQQEAEERVGT
jgi:hypothetical protein